MSVHPALREAWQETRNLDEASLEALELRLEMEDQGRTGSRIQCDE
jgi:hypothetical protein